MFIFFRYLLFYFVSSSLLAQNADIKFIQIDNNGFSSNSVISICQDSTGFMWFGTRYGLNRYDGYDVKSYYSSASDKNSISSNHINKIFEDSKNNLWIVTKSGVSRYNRNYDNFSRLKITKDNIDYSNNYYTDITEDGDGNIWILGLRALIKFKTPENNIINENFESFYNLSHLKPKCLYVSNEKTLWIGTENGLFILNDNEVLPFQLNTNGKEIKNTFINKIYELENGKFALATENSGLSILNIVNHNVTSYLHDKSDKNSLINDRVRTVYQSKNGNIWIGTREGLSILNETKSIFTNFLHKSIDLNSIPDNSIKDIYEDKFGGIWLATYAGGISNYNPENSKFKHIKKDFFDSNSMSSDKVSFLFKDREDILWVGTEGSGINSFNEKSGIIKSYSNFSGHYEALDNIKAITESDNQYLWLGTNGGLTKFDKLTHKFTNFTHNPLDSNSLSFNQIHTVLYDPIGVLWIGTNGGGLNKLNISKNLFHTFNTSNSTNKIISNNINYLLQENNGGLWIATEVGIDFLMPDRETFNRSKAFKNFQEKLATLNMITLFNDNHNYLWIGLEGGGLISVNKNNYKYQVYTTTDGLAGNITYAIQQDDKSNIWISTNKGISKLTLKYQTDSLAITKIKNFNEKDGLQSNQFSYRSSFKDKSGKFYFGGIQGYNSFYPDQILDKFSMPSVVFTDFNINYETLKANKKKPALDININQATEITLNYSQQPFSLTYAGLQFFNPDNLYYSYQLVGVDENWIFAGKQRTLTYAHLNEGNYELRVKASDNINQWNENYTKISINVLPPMWRTWWAYSLYVFVILLVLISVLYYINKWFHLKNRLTFEKLSKEKEHELHERKVQFFTDISHELRTPLTLIITPLEKLISETKNNLTFNKKIEIIQKNSRKMLLLIDQLLDLRKFEKGHIKLEAVEGNISKFIKETTLPFREIAKIRGIEFKFTTSNSDITICYDRVKMEIIIYNLLSNSFKAISSKGKVEVRLEEFEKKDEYGAVKSYIKIEVEDNGKGIPAKYQKNIFERFYQLEESNQLTSSSSGIGLELTMRMVKLHLGTIEVKSRESTDLDVGKTIFTVIIPQGCIPDFKKQIKENYTEQTEQTLYKTELLKTELLDYQVEVENRKFDEILDLGSEKPSIVIVEDNRAISNLICDLFKDDYKIKTAYDGREGWGKIISEIPDIIISDIMMPEIDGLELCRMLKTDKRTCHIPIILLTARTSVTFKFEGMETGADDYVRKPFSGKYLTMRVNSLLQQRKLVEEHLFRNSIIQPKELGLNSTDEMLLVKAIKYIEENLDNPNLTVENLSLHLGMSRVHFYRKIKSIANISAIDFIKNVRLKKASQFFEVGNHNIKEVRYLVGFNDATNFRTSFKKLFGQNPSDYIKKLSIDKD